MRIKGKTHKGLKRADNQDDFFAGQLNNIFFAVVCDGMGGVKGGGVASSTAVSVFTETVRALTFSSDDYPAILSAAVSRANEQVYTLALNQENLQGMGTTAVACIITQEGKIYIANVGDSRLYLLSDTSGSLKQITKDHSLVQSLIDSGKITKQQAENHPRRNIITRVIGTHNAVEADLFEEVFLTGSILLCSDGLYNYINDEKIREIVSEYDDIDTCLDKLIDMANENGGGDNITTVIVKY